MIGLINAIQINVDFHGEGNVKNKIYFIKQLQKLIKTLGMLWINWNKINQRVKMKFVHLLIQLKLMIVMMNGTTSLQSTAFKHFNSTIKFKLLKLCIYLLFKTSTINITNKI